MNRCIDCVYLLQDEKLSYFCAEKELPVQDCYNEACEWFQAATDDEAEYWLSQGKGC